MLKECIEKEYLEIIKNYENFFHDLNQAEELAEFIKKCHNFFKPLAFTDSTEQMMNYYRSGIGVLISIMSKKELIESFSGSLEKLK